MNTSRTTLLITLTGPDRPGVTSRLFAVLARHPLAVLDIEQVVIRGKLVLGVLLEGDGPPDLTGIYSAITALARDLGLEAEITTGSGDVPVRGGRLHVTLLGSPLAPAAITAIAGRIAASGANIDRIGRLARRPVTCIEMEVSGGDPVLLREDLARVAVDQGIDVAVQRGGLHRRALRLIVMDVDSTLIRDEVIDLLAARAGRADEVAAVTAAAMRGELDFAAALRERVGLLAGLGAGVLDEVRGELRLTAGARTLIGTLGGLGYKFGIVSGGFGQVIAPLAAELGIGYVAANALEISAGRLTGRLSGPVIDRAAKADALRRFAADAGVPLSQTVAVGDGANDLDMIAAAGLGIAFNAKPVVRDAADTSLSVPYLDAILYLLGISSDEVLDGAGPGGTTPLEPPGALRAPLPLPPRHSPYRPGGYSGRLAAVARSGSVVAPAALDPGAASTAGGAPSTAGETAPATSAPDGASSPMPAERRLEITMATTMMITAASATPTRRPTLLLYFTMLVAISSETRFITLISGLIAGPAVSLNGSPTVSPMTVAACASEPLPPCAPSSTTFLALSQAPPELARYTAISTPTAMAPAR
jgi:phosphoserine phosphatase